MSDPPPSTPELRASLLRWFDRHRRDLPWRRTRDPYAIWLSEVMLQQTQVATVIPYWERFLATFPTLKALAAAPPEAVFPLWRGLGYYSRAKNLHRAAVEVAAAHGGQLPRTADALRALPGFGPYTAGAVASIAFGEEAPLVDGNVARVFSRLFALEGAPGNRDRERQLWATAERLVKGERPGDWNQALMELGALVCRADSPLCLLCPVAARCEALRQGRVDELPHRKVRAARKPLVLLTAVWRQGDRVLLGRRAPGGLFGGLWELPCVPLEEQPDVLRAGFGAPLRVGPMLAEVRRTLTHRDLSIRLFEVEGPVPRVGAPYLELRWSSSAEAGELGMSTAMRLAVEAVASAAPEGGAAGTPPGVPGLKTAARRARAR